jgi:hypothetical protein
VAEVERGVGGLTGQLGDQGETEAADRLPVRCENVRLLGKAGESIDEIDESERAVSFGFHAAVTLHFHEVRNVSVSCLSSVGRSGTKSHDEPPGAGMGVSLSGYGGGTQPPPLWVKRTRSIRPGYSARSC